jgi:hypothetical protein
MDPDKVLSTVNTMIDDFSTHYQNAEAARVWWHNWHDNAPLTATEVPIENQPKWWWPANCPPASVAPSASELALAYKESIAYVNAVGGSRFTPKELDDADMDLKEADLRKMEEGEHLFVLAPQEEVFPDELRGGELHWGAPLWLCRCEEKSYATDADPSPNLKISWWACSKTVQGNMAGSWYPMCKGGHKLVGAWYLLRGSNPAPALFAARY